MDMNTPSLDVDDPVLGDVVFGVKVRLFAKIVLQAGIGDFDDQMNTVSRSPVLIGIAIRSAASPAGRVVAGTVSSPDFDTFHHRPAAGVDAKSRNSLNFADTATGDVAMENVRIVASPRHPEIPP